jgi:putative transposase
MIAQARHNNLELSVRRLCGLLGVGRSSYYEHPSMPTRAERDVALRDAIERIVLAFPGYGYRRVTKPWPGRGGASITNGCCASCAKRRYYAN